jgi:hypothetical protein
MALTSENANHASQRLRFLRFKSPSDARSGEACSRYTLASSLVISMRRSAPLRGGCAPSPTPTNVGVAMR